MASSNAHHSTGFAAGLIAAVLVFHAGASGPWHAWSILALVSGAAGGTAPDWLEVAWWSRKRKLWITHRTWTHWGIAWGALLVYSYLSLNKMAWAPAAFGFAAGGMMHLLADWPNPLGIPWILGRHSLNLWKSGKCDMVIVVSAWLAAFVVADRFCFQSRYTHEFIVLARKACLTLLRA
ncbi:metal-dependent hydrolase [Massilia dura]|uniref:Metal-dependent hydrolase n=1 Tax=Pseudoduganella dura TaxID=321982 RepID=A0A6I3XNJ2_9BURK|nr:metal-dependent hydrolase [Pseudoduganella dura]MUI14802.1 metal-dependent hydrolase [Pseudoduganella dura]GGX97958.1 hypothetical protein GCM10007386_30980 [Pseudoduganella dura]